MMRCAGLFFGLMDFADASLSPDLLQRLREDAALLVRATVAIRVVEVGGEIDARVRSTMGTVDRIARLYRLRLQSNFDRAGEALTADALVQSDLAQCQAVIGAAGQAMPQLRH
jgi:hypothetical protein